MLIGVPGNVEKFLGCVQRVRQQQDRVERVRGYQSLAIVTVFVLRSASRCKQAHIRIRHNARSMLGRSITE